MIALLAALRPGITPEETRTLLTAGAEDQVGGVTDTKGWDAHYGWGRLNAAHTLHLARTTLEMDPAQGALLTWSATDHAAERHPDRVLRSTNLITWTTMTNPTGILYTGTQTSWTDDEAGTGNTSLEDRFFYRLLITPEIP